MNWRLTGSWSTTTSSFEKHSRRHNQVEATPVFLLLYKQFFFLNPKLLDQNKSMNRCNDMKYKNFMCGKFWHQYTLLCKSLEPWLINFCAFKVVLSYSAPGFLDVFQIFLLDTECFFTCYWFSVQPLYLTIFRWMFLCLFVLFVCLWSHLWQEVVTRGSRPATLEILIWSYHLVVARPRCNRFISIVYLIIKSSNQK